MWVKILIFEQTLSRLYIYSSSNSRCLEINAQTYSAVQINSTVYIWTSLGVYKYNHQEDNDLEFVVLWPYEPRNKISCLGYVDGNLVFVIAEAKLMVYNLDSNSTTEYDDKQTWRMYSYDDGVIVFQSGRAMNLHANHHVNVSRVEPVIPWNKTQEYLWLSPSFYQSNQIYIKAIKPVLMNKSRIQQNKERRSYQSASAGYAGHPVMNAAIILVRCAPSDSLLIGGNVNLHPLLP
jgi:hypothetical protein